MGMLYGASRALLGGAKKSYIDKVLATNPIAYWPQNEKSGLVAIDQVNSPAQDGAYTGVTLNALAGPDGQPTPFFDGALDFSNIHTATLAGAFNGAEGTVMVWARVAQPPDDPWTDGSIRILLELRADAQNRVVIRKNAGANTLTWIYEANNVVETVSQAGMMTTDWFMVAMAWDKPNERIDYYLDGAPIGFDISLGAWAGLLGATTTVVGATNTTPATPWHGYLAHVPIWDRALAPAEIADLAVV